jgi:hypothetical protein
MPPPPRKILIERLPKLPEKPQKIIVEKWLPYEKQKLKRRVVYQRSGPDSERFPTPENLLVQWQPPDVKLNKQFNYLGVFETDPNEYKKKYSSELTLAANMPEFVSQLGLFFVFIDRLFHSLRSFSF